MIIPLRGRFDRMAAPMRERPNFTTQRKFLEAGALVFVGRSESRQEPVFAPCRYANRRMVFLRKCEVPGFFVTVSSYSTYRPPYLESRHRAPAARWSHTPSSIPCILST